MSEPIRTQAQQTLRDVLAKNQEATRELVLDSRARALAQAAALSEEQFEPILKLIGLAAHRQVSSGALSATVRVLQGAEWAEPRAQIGAATLPPDEEVTLDLAARIRAALFEEAILASCVTSQDAAARLGVSRSTIEKLPEESVLALGGPGRGRRYPAWQFQKGEPQRTVPGLEQVLAALDGTPLRKAVWLSTTRALWADRSASDLLQKGEYPLVLEHARATSIAL